MAHQILKIDASFRRENSESRRLTREIVAHLGGGAVVERDLAAPLPVIDETWFAASATPAEARTPEQEALLELSETLIGEIEAADVLVIGAPVYNFSIPANLKAWIDLVARAGRTFRYTENGPVGAFKGKRAIIALTSGGTQLGSAMDFASGYLRHVLGFIGITDVEFVAADQLAIDAEGSRAKARAEVEALAA